MAFARQKKSLERFGLHLSAPLKKEACLVYRPQSPQDICLGRGRTLLLGEAAGFISPSSYEGISGALNSAYILSRVFNSSVHDILKTYRKATIRLRTRYLLKIVKAAILCSRLPRRLIMKSRLKHIEVTGASRYPDGKTDGSVTPKRKPATKRL